MAMKLYNKASNIVNSVKYGKIVWSVNNPDSYTQFNDSSFAKEWGNRHYAEWSQKYMKILDIADYLFDIPNILSPLEKYCGYDYRNINNYLRNGIDDSNNYYRELSDFLMIVLISAPRIPENLVVYRLVCDEFIDSLINNNKRIRATPTTEKGFMSTSLIKDICNNPEHYSNAKNLLKIFVPKGTMGVYVSKITHRNEEEILLRPDLSLGLSAYPYFDEITGKQVYECQICNPKTYVDLLY
ncbi:ADP-ribosyltransferase [Ruminococcus sp.]|uniref:ADP-ribosyltransferase n=1 Tax=Ruminococcus sp. TaxID=41978 RepID=UPI0025FD17C8|nr:ADP-ribosyltransferase [Ruminococcus sp.]